MSDYTSDGAVPVDDAAIDEPPTVDEVLEEQRREHPEQAATHWRRGDDGPDPTRDEPPSPAS